MLHIHFLLRMSMNSFEKFNEWIVLFKTADMGFKNIITIIKSKKLWLFALSKLNILPRRHLAWQTPYYHRYRQHYNFSKSPLLPFGCRIMAYTPADLQTKLSNNARLHYYVGSAPFHKAGITLYNPKTKQTIICRSFTNCNHQIPPFHPYLFPFQQLTLKTYMRQLLPEFHKFFPLLHHIYQNKTLQLHYV